MPVPIDRKRPHSMAPSTSETEVEMGAEYFEDAVSGLRPTGATHG